MEKQKKLEMAMKILELANDHITVDCTITSESADAFKEELEGMIVGKDVVIDDTKVEGYFFQATSKDFDEVLGMIKYYFIKEEMNDLHIDFTIRNNGGIELFVSSGDDIIAVRNTIRESVKKEDKVVVS